MASKINLNFGGDSDSSEEDEEIPEEFEMPQNTATNNAAVENEETLKAFEDSFLGRFGAASTEFQEASQLILVDCWNVSAWLTMVEEVEQGRGGNTITVEVYTQFLDQFPRSAKIWKSLINYYVMRDDDTRAEEAFKSCLSKCRSVDLWVSYLAFTKKKTVDKVSKYSEQYANARKSLEAGFERAVDNIGTTCEAHIVWRLYIDFVKEWPDSSQHDASTKMAALRKVYQRIVGLPIDDVDSFWKEFETIETSMGEHLAEQILPELRTKCQHEKVVNRDRNRLSAKILFSRIATPSTNALSELQQLEYWNKFIRFELDNPGNISLELHESNMRCVFERALCCHRHNAEVWLSFAQFESKLRVVPDETVDAALEAMKRSKAVLQEGIECNPGVSILRVALAELEEANGKVASSRETLRIAYAEIPNSFTFSVLQRHIRRLDGKTAARVFFSETMSARLDGILNYEVYIAHASVESEINNDFSAAERSMQLARAVRPSLSYNVDYVMAYAAILRRLGDINPIRWLFHNALGDDICKGQNDKASVGTREKVVSNKQSRLQLWEEFLKIELSMGLSAISRTAEIRSAVVAARAIAFPQGVPVKASGGNAAAAEENIFFEYTAELFEKHSVSGISLPLVDAGVKDRCRGSVYVDELVRNAELEVNASELGKKNRGRNAPVVTSALDADSSILAGLPAFFKELLSKLPVFTGPAPDVDAFVDNLRRTVLPPRPVEDAFNNRPAHNDESAGVAPSVLGKRNRMVGRHDESAYEGGMDVIEDAEVGTLDRENDAGILADEVATSAMEDRDDIFKRRHRQKLANNE